MSVETNRCETCEVHRVEKPSWGPGPWAEEPDRCEWRHAGLPCVLHRGGAGAWCGYVGLPPGHKLHGKDYDYANREGVEVHGGLTYAQPCEGHVCHRPLPGEPDDVWWLGWDAGHAFDLSPRFAFHRRKLLPALPVNQPGFEDHYWTLAEARLETERLAEQLAAMAPG